MKPLIHFIHGKESGPWGRKITYLAGIVREMGYDADSLDYAGIADPRQRVRILAAAHAKRPAAYLVGSSMGGWVALSASALISVKGLFLLAPAIYMDGYPPHQIGCPGHAVEIVHGWRDSLIPCQNAMRFSQENRCTLHLVDDEHRLKHCLPQVGAYLKAFLERMTATA
ncbi:MAG: alpha/beta hydrolase [Oxalobacter formigenes]|nr:alpha/beta hydrolase [Oxalobacter formigenes]